MKKEVTKQERKLVGYLPEKSKVRKLDRRTPSFHDTFCYQCSRCSNDEYVKAGLCSGIFYISGYRLMAKQRSCRCSSPRKTKRIRYTEEQREYQINIACKKLNMKFVGFHGDAREGGKASRIIDVQCFCGNIMTQSIHYFLNGNRQHCGCINKGGFDDSSTGSLYVVEWRGLGTNFIKVGITNREVMDRVSDQRSVTIYNPKILFTRKFNWGYNARNLESIVFKTLKKYRGVVSKEVFPDGYTETFSMDKLDKIMILIQEYEELQRDYYCQTRRPTRVARRDALGI